MAKFPRLIVTPEEWADVLTEHKKTLAQIEANHAAHVATAWKTVVNARLVMPYVCGYVRRVNGPEGSELTQYLNTWHELYSA
jgi:hypothetical protein